jgi:Flp pilus assembly protein TadG
VAILFGFAIIPLMLGVGVAVDYGRALLVRERMQGALDAATLAVGSWPGLSDAGMQAKAQEYFNANYPTSSSFGAVSPVNLSNNGKTITVSVSGSVPTTFMRLANIDNVAVAASTTVLLGMGTAEVVLALDNSGSMTGSKIDALKTAANDLVDTLFAVTQNSPEPDPLKIAVVPFAAGVNVGSQYANASWMDTGNDNPYHADAQKAYGAPSTTNNFTLFSSLKTSSGAAVTWGGCVEARPMPYDATDDASTGDPSTLFVPMFAPDEPDNWTATTSTCSDSTSGSSSYTGSGSSRRYNCAPIGTKSYNNYLPDAGTSTTCSMVTNANWTCSSGNANCGGANTGKSEEDAFAGKSIPSSLNCKYGTAANKATVANLTVGGIPGGPNFMCTSAPILPLSSDKTTIKNAINAMTAQGATGVGEGAAWGWRALSPSEPLTGGRGYGVANNTKVMVLMTDGQNTYYPNSKFLKSWYDIYGYVERNHLGTTSTSSSTLTQFMDQRTLQICNNIKATGIIIYTVAFQIPGDQASALALLNSCASDQDKYFAPGTNAELLAAFNEIGRDLSELRVTK